MPEPLVRGFCEIMPRLDAEEAIHDATVMMVGTGSLTKQDAQRQIRRWQRMMRRDRPKQRLQSLDQLRAIGIGVVEEGKGDG